MISKAIPVKCTLEQYHQMIEAGILDDQRVELLGREYLQHHPYPEHIFWLIEFSNSSLKKDLDLKAKAYAVAGIAEYWVVNLKAMKLVVMRHPANGAYQSQATLNDGTIEPLAFPGVAYRYGDCWIERRYQINIESIFGSMRRTGCL